MNKDLMHEKEEVMKELKDLDLGSISGGLSKTGRDAIIGSSVAAIVITAVVLGSVYGSRRKSKKDKPIEPIEPIEANQNSQAVQDYLVPSSVPSSGSSTLSKYVFTNNQDSESHSDRDTIVFLSEDDSFSDGAKGGI